MRRVGSRLTGLTTRIATRTFLTFALCAGVPIVVSALVSQRVVSDELHSAAVDKLTQTSKSYGLLLFERLRQCDELLSRLASLHLEGRLSADELRTFTSRRVRIVDVRTASIRESAAPPARLRVLREPGREPQVALTAVLSNERETISITGVIAPEHLWDADAVELSGAQLCVRDEAGVSLHCVDDEHSAEASARAPSLAADWTLFLRPTYGADSWIVATSQSPQIAFGALQRFRRTLPLVATLSIAVALLLSVVQIRRSHRPLAALADAAQRIGERRFKEPIVVASGDEYGRLALAFNQMAASIGRQFSVLAALARIDRMILADPSIGAVLERTLPTLPRLLRARGAAAFVRPDDRDDTLLYVATRDDPERVRLRKLSLSDDELRMLLQGPASAESAKITAIREELLAATGCGTLDAAPIRVDRHLRGVLLIGNTNEAAHSDQRRNTRAFSRRFAVALGAEQRRHALVRQAYYDDLTGLPNRQLFKDRLRQELAHAKRNGDQVALIYVDLDRFKNVNDSLGHNAGDDLLRLAAERLQGEIRDSDTLARLGGDEFVVMASGVRESPPHVLAERLQSALAAVAAPSGTTQHIEASMGIAIYPLDGDSAEVLLRNADTAMYRAKAAGGGCAVYFEEEMTRKARRRLDVEQRLRVALSQRALSLVYQPKIRTLDGVVCGVEALTRWSDAELGYVSPGEFVPVAEECGLINPLGEWAMHEACTAYQSWRARGVDVGHVGVNVSMRQLRDERFLERVQRVLTETRTPPSALELEVTESTLADRPRQVMWLLDELRALGVRIAIDDFGVGYSSMAALGHLPADSLKIDRSFVEHCATRPQAASIVEAIICMAHALGKVTVAEGVETPEQLAVIRNFGCDIVQGYLLAHPLSSDDLLRFCAGMKAPEATVNSEGETGRAIAG
jgi:diguanylate cyclase (GGDEF)-like protein